MTSTQTADPAAADPDRPGVNPLGRITIDDSVVVKIAARAAAEVPDAGAAAPRVLGRSVTGVPIGVRHTDLDGLPRTTVDVDESVARIQLTLSVRWPASVADVTAAVRSRVIERVGDLTGLRVDDVRITVSDLVTHLNPPPRVR